MKLIRPFADPIHEARNPGMAPQCVDIVVGPRKLGLGQRRMDLVVANLMQQHGRPTFPSAQLGYQMVQALFGVRRDRALAERADGGVVHG